jgi:hypothetical protein
MSSAARPQDRLRADSTGVARVALTHEPEALADVFAATSRDCIHCHDAYLAGR